MTVYRHLCKYSPMALRFQQNWRGGGGYLESKQVQLTSDEDSNSGSDLDCSGLVDSDDDCKKSPATDKHNSGVVLDHQQASTSGLVGDSIQSIMNEEILNQLTKLGQRLDVLDEG